MSSNRASHQTILVAEDEAFLRELARKVLQRSGYHVLAANSGEAAVSIWKQHAREIDLLVTDMMMPNGMTGKDLARQLQAQKPGLKVLFTTGSGYDEMDFAGDESFHFLQKPFLPGQLAQAVRECLDGF